MSSKSKTLTRGLESIVDEKWRLTPASMMEHLTNGKFVRFPHIRYIDEIVAPNIATGGARIILSMPPRHGKSQLVSYALPVWLLSLWPNKKVILASYEAGFAATWGRAVRNFLIEHESKLGVSLCDDSQASDRWSTTEGGGMITAGIGGPLTGQGGQLLIVDDPIKNWEESRSELMLQKQIDWFNSTLATRAEPGASIVVVMTRWHDRDLAARLLSQPGDEWTEIRLPALAEEGDPLGRAAGEALCPQRYTAEALSSVHLAMGSMMFNSLYQQDPTPDATALVKRDWIQFHDKSDFCDLVISWDTSFGGKTTADYNVGVVVGRRIGDPRYYIVDIVRKKMDFVETLAEMKRLSSIYRDSTMLIERAANGAALYQSLKSQMERLIEVPATSSKESRLMAIIGNFQAGDILFPDTDLAKICIEETLKFPNGRNDDFVDALTQAIIFSKGSGWSSRQSVANMQARTDEELHLMFNGSSHSDSIDPHGAYGFWDTLRKQNDQKNQI